jgi:GcrA cell cycle regulator
MNSRNSFPWDEDHVATLKRQWLNGLTASQVAKELGHGLTRSAVIGKLGRLGLLGARQKAETKALNPMRPIMAKPRRPGAQPNNVNHGIRRHSPNFSPAPSIEAPLKPKPAVRSMKLVELENNSCRWPFGDPGTKEFYFCGAPTANLAQGEPYCEDHADIAFAKRQ